MVGAAPGFPTELLQAGRTGEALFQDGNDTVRAIASETFLPVTEQLISTASLEEEIDHQLQHFAVVPQAASGLENRWTQQVCSQLLLLASEPVKFTKAIKTGAVAHDMFDQRVECAIGIIQMLVKVAVRKFDGNEAMLPASRAPGAKAISAPNVKTRGQGLKIQLFFSAPNGATADQIQAQLDTLAMNRPGPFGGAGFLKIVSLDAHTQVLNAAVKRAVAVRGR
jgi:hypothetical protein